MPKANNIVSYIAASALDAYEVVKVDTDGKVALPASGSDAAVIGVTQRTVAAGDPVDVLIYGITRAKAGAALTLTTDNLLMAANDGELVVATSSNFPVARTLPNINQKSTAGAGEEIFIMFFGPSVVKA